MDYLYIPTTTLNFNNILSTGSISPVAMYAERQFGYKQFYVVQPNPFKTLILLYDRFPEFVLEDAYRDSYPLVLRMRSDRLPRTLERLISRMSDVSVFACYETIYFDPTSIDLLFSSQESLRSTLAKSEPSLTTKLVDIFRPYMRVISPSELDSFTWSSTVLEEIKIGNSAVAPQYLDDDNRINRLKGFASGYILGAYKSIDSKVAHIRSHFRVIKNEVSSMLNDPARKYPNALRKDVEFSCSTLEQFFAETDIGTQKFDFKMGDDIRIDDGQISSIRDHNETDPRSTRSLIRLVNDYCFTSKFYGQLDEVRLKVAMEGAIAIRNIIGDQWEGSSHQKYINSLLNNIKSGSEFDFSRSTSLTLQSFAAFILKGDDLQKLEAFLTSQGIGDFRTAFALWGAMFGFSKLPKTLYNFPIQQGEKVYTEQMHAYVHCAVHRLTLNQHNQPQTAREMLREPMKKIQSEEFLPQVLAQLQKEIPSSTKWIPKLRQLLKDSGGNNEHFFRLFRNTTVPQLGGTIKGIRKEEVGKFLDASRRSQYLSTNGEPLFQNSLCLSKSFIDDETCIDSLKEMQDLPEEKRSDLAESLKGFQVGYRPGEFYGKNHQTYPRDNDSTVNHFINCLYSQKTKELNVSLTEEERERIFLWLRSRYEI